MKVCEKNVRISGGAVRIARLDADMYQFLSDPAEAVRILREGDARVDLFTFTQTIADTAPRYKFPMEWENLAVLPVPSYDEWWTKTIGFKARNKAKQAEKKGVVLREVPFSEELVQGIWKIYNETPVRQERPYPHYGKSLETVYMEAATYLDSSAYIGAYFEGELIGFIKMMWDDAKIQAGLMNIVSMIRHRDKAPTNALLAHAVRACADRGIAHVVYSHFAYGKRDRDNLTEFKERNGFHRVDLPRYWVPLTAWGRVALTLGLHQRFVDRLPENVGLKLRDLRSRWYSRKMTASGAFG